MTQPTMTSAERVHAALAGRLPDHVPILEIAVHPEIARALVPDCRDVPDALDRLGLDAVCCGADWERYDETAATFTDEWGVTYGRGPEMLDHPIDGPVKTREDLRNWRPPDPDAPHRLATLRDLVARYKGRRAIIFYHRAAFMWSAYVAGMDNLLENSASDPEFVQALFGKVVACNERIIRNAIRAGAEVAHVADDYAANEGPFFSPAMFRRLVLPCLQHVIDAIHEEGALAVKHTDGDIWPLIEDIVNTGADGLNPLEPVAGMDLGRVKAAYGHRICLVGNIDCGELLCHGSPQDVDDAVREAIRVAGPGGRYIVSSSNSIHSSVKPENYGAMIEAVKKWGAYPL